MPLVTFACPDCNSVLKSPTRIAAGQTIKCPKCGNTFVMSEPGEATALNVMEGVRDGYAGGPIDRQPPKRRAAKRNGGRTTALVAGGILLGLIALGGGAYSAWDKLMNNGRNAGSGDEQPLAYVPADSSLVLFINFETLMNLPTVGQRIEESLSQTQGGGFFADCRRETGLEFKDLLNQITYGFKVPNLMQLANRQAPQGMTAVIRSRVPFDQRKIARSAKGAVAKKMQGKTYYEINDHNFRYLFMPSDRIMVLTNVPEGDLGTIVGSGGTQPVLPAETVAMARDAQDCQFWMLAPMTGSDIRQAIGDVPLTVPAGMKGVVNALPRAKAGGMWLKLDGDRVFVTAGLSCADEASAKLMTGALQALWLLARAALPQQMAKSGPGMSSVSKELMASTQFAHDGSLARATAQINMQSLEIAIREAQARARIMQTPGILPRAGVPPTRPFPVPGTRRPTPENAPRS